LFNNVGSGGRREEEDCSTGRTGRLKKKSPVLRGTWHRKERKGRVHHPQYRVWTRMKWGNGHNGKKSGMPVRKQGIGGGQNEKG